jgi:hypothetical protein
MLLDGQPGVGEYVRAASALKVASRLAYATRLVMTSLTSLFIAGLSFIG